MDAAPGIRAGSFIAELARRAIEGPVPEHLVIDEAAYARCRNDLAPMLELLRSNPQLATQVADTCLVSGAETGDIDLDNLALRAVVSPTPANLAVDAEQYLRCKQATLTDTARMEDLLSSNPQLQEQVAFALNYVPSKWLLSHELQAVIDRRNMHGVPAPAYVPGTDPYNWALEGKLQGLCFSGGGIRSATFNLGVLQGLADLGLLKKFDYLSSVSGGGYIHEWLAAWIKREDHLLAKKKREEDGAPQSLTGLDNIQERLKPIPSDNHIPFSPEPIRWLRRYSNYLTPKTGIFTADAWVAFAIWMRNTFLNQVILISFLFFLVLLPHLISAGQWSLVVLLSSAPVLRPVCSLLTGASLESMHKAVSVLFAIAFFSFASVMLWLALHREYRRVRHADIFGMQARQKDRITWGGGERLAQWLVVLPLLVACFLLTHALVLGVNHRGLLITMFILLSVQMTGLALAGGVIRAYKANHGMIPGPAPSPSTMTFEERVRKSRARVEAFLRGTKQLLMHPFTRPRTAVSPEQTRTLNSWRVFFSAVIFSAVVNGALAAAGGLGVFLLIAALLQFQGFTIPALILHLPSWLQSSPANPALWRLQLSLGPPLLLFVPFFSMVLAAGLVGRNYPDWLREWLARVRAWCMLFAFAWALYFGIALLGPSLFNWFHSTQYRKIAGSIKWATLVGWVGTTIGSVLAAKAKKCTGTPQDSSVPLNLLAKVGPYVFIVGLFIILSAIADFAFAKACVHRYLAAPLFFLPMLIFLLFGWRVDINEFSMNSFYRNRLTRAYLGASNAQRDPNPLTGFDDRDTRGMQVSQLQPSAGYSGPLPIINTTLNLSFGEDLAWQERKAASFAFSPIFSGYTVGWTAGKANSKPLNFNGFVPTAKYYTPDGGINIATAVAISGAAASPNWGFHTNPATAFLMTLFNVRLGWWIFNPRRSIFAGCVLQEGETRMPEWPSPRFAPRELYRELLGRVDDTSDYVYLSDGGHFDNMGLYELVRRRCYRIVICDAEADEHYLFEGLGMAIRKCRIDFGVEITMKDIANLRVTLKTGNCKAHFATGTIRYPETPNESEKLGSILYIKSSLTGPVKWPADPGAEPSTKPSSFRSLDPEPLDVLNYKLEHSSFPHDTTADQWFSESQFESYRRLGQHVVEEVKCCSGWADFGDLPKPPPTNLPKKDPPASAEEEP